MAYIERLYRFIRELEGRDDREELLLQYAWDLFQRRMPKGPKGWHVPPDEIRAQPWIIVEAYRRANAGEDGKPCSIAQACKKLVEPAATARRSARRDAKPASPGLQLFRWKRGDTEWPEAQLIESPDVLRRMYYQAKDVIERDAKLQRFCDRQLGLQLQSIGGGAVVKHGPMIEFPERARWTKKSLKEYLDAPLGPDKRWLKIRRNAAGKWVRADGRDLPPEEQHE
jgi:hypothetical protein